MKKTDIGRLVVLTVITFAIWSCAQGGGNAPSVAGSITSPSTTPTPSPSPSPSPSPTPTSARVYGKVSTASTGAAIQNASVDLYSGASLYSSVNTDSSGNYVFSTVPNGSYTANFTASGYVSINNVAVNVNGADVNLNESMTTPTVGNQLRIVLTWYSNTGSNVVADLDAYTSVDGSTTKVFYNTKSVTWPDGSSGTLDHDVSNYSGPETITLSNITTSTTYHYYVNNYSSSTSCFALSQSGVHVDVYAGSSVVKSYDVPPNTSHGGVIYEVFKVANGQIVDVMAFNNSLVATKTNTSCP